MTDPTVVADSHSRSALPPSFRPLATRSWLLATAFAILLCAAPAPTHAQRVYVSADAGALFSTGDGSFQQSGLGLSARARAGIRTGTPAGGVSVFGILGWLYATEEEGDGACRFSSPMVGAGARFEGRLLFFGVNTVRQHTDCVGSGAQVDSSEMGVVTYPEAGVRLFGLATVSVEIQASKPDAVFGRWATLRVGVGTR